MGMIVTFPMRQVGAVLVVKESDPPGWTTVCGSHGWLHGSFRDACAEADHLALNLGGVPIRIIARCES